MSDLESNVLIDSTTPEDGGVSKKDSLIRKAKADIEDIKSLAAAAQTEDELDSLIEKMYRVKQELTEQLKLHNLGLPEGILERLRVGEFLKVVSGKYSDHTGYKRAQIRSIDMNRKVVDLQLGGCEHTVEFKDLGLPDAE